MERGWQVSKSLADRLVYILDQQIDCDVTFVFPPADHPTRISAHKLILKSGSPVFEAMFSGNFKEISGVTEIIDIEPRVFTEMLRYLYTDEAEVTATSVLALISSAQKYMIDGLASICWDFLVEDLNEENVCGVLSDSIVYDEPKAADICCKFIGPRVLSVIKYPDFMQLSQAALLALLKSRHLRVYNEVSIYEACLAWARQRTDKPESGADIRQVLGDCLLQIRFHDMQPEDFANKIASISSLLTPEEKSHIYGYAIAGNERDKDKLALMGFSLTRRRSPFVVLQRGSDDQKQLGWAQSTVSGFQFSASQQVFLHGVGVYVGQNTGDTCTVTLELAVKQDRRPTIEKRIIKMECKQSGKPTNMYFKTTHELVAGKQYVVKVAGDGSSQTYYQQYYKQSVTFGDITLTFNNNSPLGVSYSQGPISELLLSKV